MNERAKFCLEWKSRWEDAEGGRVDVAELCRVFGISRQRGYVWLRRFKDAGHDVRALEDRSRRPLTSPTAISESLQEMIVWARKRHPRWGPRKLRAWLVRVYPGREFPSASSIATILQRRGLTTPRRKRRRRTPPMTLPFAEPTVPNALWCIDFKGEFKTGNGEWCRPFTITDAYTRYCIRCEIVDEGTRRAVENVLDSAFREFGLPTAIRSDNGPPFAANGPAGLTTLAVWLLRLGIRLERITPGKPQENGRHERFHRTLQEDAASPPRLNARSQQRAFDLFRREYNSERPHEALGNRTPASLYVPSTRHYPRELLQAHIGHQERLDAKGRLLWARKRIFVSSALAHEFVTLVPANSTTWLVILGEDIVIGEFNMEQLERGVIGTKPPGKSHSLAFRSTNGEPASGELSIDKYPGHDRPNRRRSRR